MNEIDSLRKVLYGKAITAVTSLNLPCKIGDEPFVTPTDGSIYGEFWFRTGKTDQIELGGPGSYECTKGLMQFTLYSPENSGEGPVFRFGDALRSLFNRQTWKIAPDGYVNLHVMACEQLPGVIRGHKVVIVDGSFDYYHRNPNPVTLLND